jgi:anti-sigma B factor antagonist
MVMYPFPPARDHESAPGWHAYRPLRGRPAGCVGPGRWYRGWVEQLKVSVAAGHSYTVVALAGESDVYTYDQLRGALESEVAGEAGLLVVDLSGLGFMDSTGVQVLLDIRVMMNDRGGRLALVSPQATVSRVLNLVGADQLIPVYGTLKEATDGAQPAWPAGPARSRVPGGRLERGRRQPAVMEPEDLPGR